MSKKDDIALDLAACKEAFDQARVPWVIMGGIVLGYARYKEIMEWDTDLDVGVFIELTNAQWQNLYNSLVRNGFRVPSVKTDFILGSRKVEFNMWCFHKSGQFYESFPKSTPGLKFVEKAIWYDSPQTVDFLSGKYPIPNNLEDYLVCQYGEDWKTNVVKNHEQYYLDKRGSRDVGVWPAGRATKYGDMWPKVLKVTDNMGE